MTVVVYGATGYTGRLVAAELARRGLAPLLAGRNARKLARVSDEVAQGAPFRIAAADDRPALRRMLAVHSVPRPHSTRPRCSTR